MNELGFHRSLINVKGEMRREGDVQWAAAASVIKPGTATDGRRNVQAIKAEM
jgi:hypothetical protein